MRNSCWESLTCFDKRRLCEPYPRSSVGWLEFPLHSACSRIFHFHILLFEYPSHTYVFFWYILWLIFLLLDLSMRNGCLYFRLAKQFPSGRSVRHLNPKSLPEYYFPCCCLAPTASEISYFPPFLYFPHFFWEFYFLSTSLKESRPRAFTRPKWGLVSGEIKCDPVNIHFWWCPGGSPSRPFSLKLRGALNPTLRPTRRHPLTCRVRAHFFWFLVRFQFQCLSLLNTA